MDIAAAADEDVADVLVVDAKAGDKSTFAAAVGEVVLASEAAMDRKLVGGACRKDPTYGLFLLLPPNRRELSRQVACFRSVTTLGLVVYLRRCSMVMRRVIRGR